MNSFLGELAKQLAGKWLSLLVVPGALFVASVVVGWRIRFGMWPAVDRFFTDLRDGRVTGLVLVAVAVGVLLVSAWAGILARTLGRATHWLWLGQWPLRTGVPLARIRGWRWKRAHRRYEEAFRQDKPDQVLARLAHRRNRVSLAPPARPTWMGDQIAALSTRVQVEYHLDLEFGWPRLWLVLPEEVRTVLEEARESFNGAAALAGWGVLYTIAGVLWWPLGLVGLVTLVSAVVRGRSAASNLAQLMESAVDLHGGSLASTLGITVQDNRLTPEVGSQITRAVRKGA
ncbi:hypothetical protein SK854_00790 [Lentzea sp. BCCO 10_0061]|uniref:Uncharacterized protein n=1 Tax=Lentzea sokolovensis TaxID=3095429 RepID=A0ABU4UPJ0_9PSEU|nr:hypothetical protein [Lentzea sp. BCCO 10_0061]MDX8140630.1 hypothetical protein [Lentzea sp. BCCO 10_0061]